MLDIPPSHCYGDLVLVHRRWLSQVVIERSLPGSFPEHPDLSEDDLQALLRQGKAPPSPPPQTTPSSSAASIWPPGEVWEVVKVDRHPRKKTLVCPIHSPDRAAGDDVDEMCFSEVLRYVSQSNFVNLWKQASKSWRDPHDSAARGGGKEVLGLEHDVVLLEVVRRLCGRQCPVILATSEKAALPRTSFEQREQEEAIGTHGHKARAYAIVVEDESITVLRPFQKYSVHQALTFSPGFFGDSAHKLLFVGYQLLHGVREIHSLGLTIGDISLHDVGITNENYVSLRPHVQSNLLEVKLLCPEAESKEAELDVDPAPYLSTDSAKLMKSLRLALRNELQREEVSAADALVRNFLGTLVNMWTHGVISNFDYIMFLNYLCGRTYANPNHYPVVPWVRDFSGKVGGWRDLSKSKFRLNKGDTQLNLTYDSLSDCREERTPYNPHGSASGDGCSLGLHLSGTAQAAHHVTDVLSEITYYVYKSRQTSKSVLCKHVRNRWVPAEYPSSMQRLQAWTPDECIPDFFTDPTIFKSIHDDLPDLELPAWCRSPEEFITWHRASMECHQVSERLHHWIDLTFGYKLSGGSAVRAKNVCLPLVDDHADLRVNGVVQLFDQHHPPRDRENPFWASSAPRFDSILGSQASADADSDLEDLSSSEVSLNRSRSRASLVETSEKSVASDNKTTITLPSNYDPLCKILGLDCMNSFLLRSGTSLSNPVLPGGKSSGAVGNLAKELSQRKIVRDMQVLGCMLTELFLPKKFLALGRHADLRARFKICRSIMENEQHLLPICIRQTAQNLLLSHFQIEPSDRYPPVSNEGLPPPSGYQLLVTQASSLSFPKHFPIFAKILRQVEDIGMSAAYAYSGDIERDEKVLQKIGEFQVHMISQQLHAIVDEISNADVGLILPLVKKLLADSPTAIMAAWYLFDPVAKVLGRRATTSCLLMPMLSIYEGVTQTSKHLKLYHRTFLQFLLVRFGTQTFLKYFSTLLIEAVGGYKDYDDDSYSGRPVREGLERCWLSADINTRPSSRLSATGDDTSEGSSVISRSPDVPKQPATSEDAFAEGEVFAFDSLSLNEEPEVTPTEAKELKTKGVIYIPPPSGNYDDADEQQESDYQRAMEHLRLKANSGNISQVAGESVLWLSHRIGPVLTAKYISRNLLRMLNLCYQAPDSAVTLTEKFPDQKIRIGPKKIHGDNMAYNVLECLAEIACLFGDHIILLQYLPYAWDLLDQCKKKLNPNLEAGLLGVTSLLHHIVIPYLSDSIVMRELSDNILANILFPTLQVMTSRSAPFYGGWRLRQALVYKFLDVTYLIGLRIGEEMSRSHLTPLCAAFFSSFDKVYDRDGRPLEIIGESAESKLVSAELARVLSPEVAYAAYVAFYNLMGRTHLDASIVNLEVVKTLCLLQQDRGSESLPRPATFTCLRGGHLAASGVAVNADQNQHPNSTSSPLSPGGNKVDSLLSHQSVFGPTGRSNDDLHSLIAKDLGFSSSSRHLRGNWLAYWEHEIGRAEKDTKFNLKQIKLQGFTGHSAGIKSLFVLDNENSFMSGSRDRTVKVWSLRSQGDGGTNVSCQWTYSAHKKSVFAVHFMESVRLAGSCDSSIHVWDPFVGAAVRQIDHQRLGPVHVMTPLPSPLPSVVVGATQDSVLHLVDCRLGAVVMDLKVSVGSTGLIKALSASADGSTVLVGHSSGYISLLDLRTGKLRHSWRGHEGEILNLTPLTGNEFMSTSLDQTVSIWTVSEGKLKCHLPGNQEPVHCVSFVEESGDIVSGTTANRINVRHGTAQESPHHTAKLRPEIVKGNLMTMKVLPINRLLLLGQDNGNLTLLC